VCGRFCKSPEAKEAPAHGGVMQALDAEQPAFPHPAAWAPFIVVGEGGAPEGTRNVALQ
jgi:hypothetical protein